MLIGCSKHKESLTKAIINIYTIHRVQIISKQYGKINDEKRKQEKEYRKRAKLVSTTAISQINNTSSLIKKTKKSQTTFSKQVKMVAQNNLVK